MGQANKTSLFIVDEYIYNRNTDNMNEATLSCSVTALLMKVQTCLRVHCDFSDAYMQF